MNQHALAFAGSVVQQSQGSIKQLQGLAKTISGSAPAEVTKKIKQLAQEEERLKRRASLQAFEPIEVFKGDLMWMAEKGVEEDLYILRQVRETSPHESDDLVGLFNLAEQKILARLSDPQQELQIAFGLTDTEFVSFLRDVKFDPMLQQVMQITEILKRIKQSWEEQFRPEGLKQWFRKPVPALGGKTPLEAVMEGRAEEVWHILGRLEAIPS